MASAFGLACRASRFPESRAAVRRRVRAGLASSQPPPAAAPPPGAPRAPAGGDAGSQAGPPRSEDGARRREQRQPSAFRSSPPPPAASRAPRPAPPLPAAGAPSAPPPAAPTGCRLTRRRTAGRSAPPRLPGAGGGGGTAGRADSPARLPPPGPRGGWARRCSQDALHHSGSGGERHPPPRAPAPAPAAPCARHALPGAGCLRTGLILPGLLISPPKLDTGDRAVGRLATREAMFISGVVFTVHCYSLAHAAAPGLCPVRKCKSTPNPSRCTQRDQSCACV